MTTLATRCTAPLFAPLARWLPLLPPRPESSALTPLLAAHPIYTDSGQRIHFAPPVDDGRPYECRIWDSGAVETRPDNWHDFFNALVWLSFPRSKQAITAAHVASFQHGPAPGRGAIRDGLTHFDECGIIVLASKPELLELLRNFAWKTLFVDHRAEVMADMRFLVFGHATYEQLLTPFRGLTAKALLFTVSPEFLAQPIAEQLPTVDQLLADKIRRLQQQGQALGRHDLHPLPLLGLPGMTPANEDPAYYDDTWQFRPGRRQPAPTA